MPNSTFSALFVFIYFCKIPESSGIFKNKYSVVSKKLFLFNYLLNKFEFCNSIYVVISKEYIPVTMELIKINNQICTLE